MKYYKTHASADAGNRYKTYCVRQRVRERGVDFASHENFFTHWQLWNTICIVNCERGRERVTRIVCVYISLAPPADDFCHLNSRAVVIIFLSPLRAHTRHTGNFLSKWQRVESPRSRQITELLISGTALVFSARAPIGRA